MLSRRIALALAGAWLAAPVPGRAAPAPSPIPPAVAALADAYLTSPEKWAPYPDRDIGRQLYAYEFLAGFVTPGMTSPGAPGLMANALAAGQAFWREHPQERDAIMRGYGYAMTETTGRWVTGFETSRFEPDPPQGAASRPPWDSERWWTQAWPEFHSSLPPPVRSAGRHASSTTRCRLRGWLSPPGSYGHMNLYNRQFFIVDAAPLAP